MSDIKGYPHVKNVAVGDQVKIKVNGHWRKAEITWIGDLVVFARDLKGAKHKVNRFTSTLRVQDERR